jgi:hypothetical protein
MKIKTLQKNLTAFVLTIASMTLPTLVLAGPAYGVSVDSSGNVGASIGSSASAIAANNGGYGGYGGGFMLSNQYGLPQGSILGIASNALFWLLAIFAILGVVGFVLSGIFYLLAGTNEDLAKKGKSGMTNSIIGIIVGLSGFLIMQAVNAFLGGNSKNF